MRSWLALLAAILLAACSGGADRDVTVVVPPGASLKAAANILGQQGAIESASGFLRHVKIFGSPEPIKPGEYEINAGMDLILIHI